MKSSGAWEKIFCIIATGAASIVRIHDEAVVESVSGADFILTGSFCPIEEGIGSRDD